MEYDNDRPVKPFYKPEIFYWIIAFLFYPLVNFASFFYRDIVFLPVLLAISLLMFLFYFLYAKAIVPWLLFTNRYVRFGVATLALYGIAIAFLRLLYSFVHLEENPLELL
ncbi:MAG TPA: hypothetical protein VIJ92_15455, partial [Ginsengibacter sp.]